MKNIVLLSLLIFCCIVNLKSQITIDVSTAENELDYKIEYANRIDQTKYQLTLSGFTNYAHLTSIKINSQTIPIIPANHDSANSLYSDPNFKRVIDSPAGGLSNALDFKLEVTYNGKNFVRNIKFEEEQNNGPLSNTQQLDRYIKTKWGAFARTYYNEDLNVVLAGKTIHVFLDENGRFYFSSLPTTAREDYNYKFHFFYIDDEQKDFVYTIQGTYDPKFEVYGADNIGLMGKGWEPNSTATRSNQPTELQTGNEGPFTESFNVKIYNRTDKKVVIDKTVKVAKTHHVSLGVGLFSSLLKNPTDIEKVGIPGTSDSTFIANDPHSRGFFTIMATFYPKPRNLLYPSTDWREKIGISIGTALNKDQFENFFGGISYDVARGLGIVAGVHYGRKTVISYDNNFEFGSQILPDSNQPIVTHQQWTPGFFIGTTIDFRIFELLFRPSIAR